MTSRFRTLDDLDVAGRTVLVRCDLNVPMEEGRVTDATRIRRSAPTIARLLDRGAAVIVLSHFGRPKGPEPSLSQAPLAPVLAEALGRDVSFAQACVGPEVEGAARALEPGQVLLLENLRFHRGEEANDPAFVAQLARLGQLYVNDAFSAAHRAHASVEGLARALPAAAGLLMQAELAALGRALGSPDRPVMAIVGGAKVSTKLDLLENLVTKVDTLVVAGAMANTFLLSFGQEIGRSLAEREMVETARAVFARARAAGCHLLLPKDAIVAAEFRAHTQIDHAHVGAVPADRMILDIGPETVDDLKRRLAEVKTVVWNGPLGAFETPPFDQGTIAVARAVAMATKSGRLVSVAGGGDTNAALLAAGVEDEFTYLSAAGGAFLEWLEGKTLPGVAALEAAAA